MAENCKKKVFVKCDCCGKIYKEIYSSFYKNQLQWKENLCKSCLTTRQHQNLLPERSGKMYQQLVEICNENEYKLLSKQSDLVNAKVKVKYECPIHGIQEQYAENIIKGHKCFKCSYESNSPRIEAQRYDKDYVESVVNSYNHNILLNKYEYTNVRSKLKIRCGSCGKIYYVSFDDYLHNQQIKCRSCSAKESKGETRIREYLENNSIKYEQEKRFPECADKKELPFDFYIPESNIIIEFDGPHHYRPVFSEEHYKMTKSHDEVKNKFCYENNINIVRIPYWDYQNIEIILDKLFKSVG